MALNDIISGLNSIAADQLRLSELASGLAKQAQIAAQGTSAIPSAGSGFFITGLTVFVLACFVGYYVVWRVTPALHSPLMAVTNAVSSVIIVGALLAAGPSDMSTSKVMGLVAVALASINIFGGFIVTGRMLAMYKKKTTGTEKAKK
jgi:NAD(P) transhydrogenase subunit alpha